MSHSAIVCLNIAILSWLVHGKKCKRELRVANIRLPPVDSL